MFSEYALIFCIVKPYPVAGGEHEYQISGYAADKTENMVRAYAEFF